MKKLVVGILAHVDAGKTTLSEGLLFSSGAINKLGRVDRRDAYLDTFSLERERGITIFSKQAVINLGETEITLVDTPGHIDFSCEAERALSVQDYAILVISASDGVQAHTKTLWQLLRARRIPTFIFVNKTDISELTQREIMDTLVRELSPGCVNFSAKATAIEDAAGRDEALMAEFFDTGALSLDSLRDAIYDGKVFPCYFGSALKMNGVREFLEDLDKYTIEIGYSERLFGARVYKISRDQAGKRLTYMKITGGSLVTKDTVKYKTDSGEIEEKIEEIRIYSGEKYRSVRSACAGTLCAVLGPTATAAGMGLGFEVNDNQTLAPVLNYKIILPEGTDYYEAYLKLITLTEEDPALALSYDPKLKEIRVRLMGEIQIEVLRRIIKERFNIDAEFGEGSILYKETISDEVRGAGHFEPLRHYAEVHLKLEPLPRGEGIICDSDCSTDLLSLNWQRLVLGHLEEKVHKGVLVGAPITDVKITLTAGRAHLKHTEGGDFRQATYRAVRQALMKARSVLLEPTFNFKIDLPTEYLGRAMTDISSMHGTADAPIINESRAILTGTSPVATMRSYATELRAYTRGEGKLILTVGDYAPCHNAEEVIARVGYSPELDERNTPNSVFCKAGSGYVVPWYEADAAMHLSPDEGEENTILENRAVRAAKVVYSGTAAEDKELMRIFEATYGKIKERRISERVENSAEKKPAPEKPKKPKPRGEDHLIIDGYNFIFANDFFKKQAELDISLARDTLVRIMCDYAAYRRTKVIVAFDAYKRKGGEGSVERCGNVTVVYTKESETADAYIERTTHELAKNHTVRVVSSDKNEQMMILGSGGLRVSATEFMQEINMTDREIREVIESLK